MSDTKKKRLPIIELTVVLLIVVLGVIILVANNKAGSGQSNTENFFTEQEQEVEKWQEGVISHNGKDYIYNQDIKTYLIMGVDKDGKVETAEDYQSGGQSDAMFLLVTNGDDQTMSVISINRNTMTRVDTYHANGLRGGYVEAQICTQHGFGDGRQLSCTRTVDAVSYLFYNLPINGYLSLRMGALPIMNDAIGGVELTVLQDLEYAGMGVSFKEGETKVLSGTEAYCYLRGRDLNEFDSASDRLRRQEQYITSFVAQAKAYTGGSATKMLSIYESVEDYIVTNIDFANLASELSQYEYDASRMYTIPGEAVMGETFEEYHVNESEFYQMIIDIFYQEV